MDIGKPVRVYEVREPAVPVAPKKEEAPKTKEREPEKVPA